MQIKRNYLYKVRIALEDPAGDTYGKVTHAINVKDWTNGVTLAWAGDENLYKNDAVANYTVTDASGEYTLAGVKHYIVLPYNDDHFATFHVESTSTKSGMSLTCAAEAIPATEGGYQVEISRLPEEYVYREDGTFTQKWEVKVKESALPLAEIGTTLEFKLQNAMASANSTSFKITGVQPSMPSFSLLANGASGSNTSANVFATTNENPTTIYAVPLDGTVSLEVETKGGAILEILDGSQWTNATNSITLSGSDLAADNQSFVQKVDFTLNTTRGKLTKFRLKNAATPDDETLWRTFTLNAMKIPLEYMAQGVIKNGSADADGSWEQDYTQTQGWIFSRTNMLSYFDGGFTSYYYKDGTKYTSSCHVPTLEEWHGIVSGAAIDFQDLRNSTSNYTSQTADICGLHLTGFTDTYSQTGNGSASTDADIIYAIRFVDAQWEGQPTASNLWKIAYRYTLMGTKLWTKIESVYLGPNDATTIDNIKNASWWSGKTIVTRLMPWYPISSEGAKSKTNSNCVGECHSIDNELQGYCSGNAHLSSYYANYSSNNLVMPFTDE